VSDGHILTGPSDFVTKVLNRLSCVFREKAYLEAEGVIFEIKLEGVFYCAQSYRPITELEL